MKNIIKNSKLIIFDLDGTLYEDTDHFDFFANQLMKKLPLEKQSDFVKEYHSIKEGNHIVSIGKVYDVKRDYVLTMDPFTLEIKKVHNWNGRPVHEKIKALYPGQVTYDFENMIAIGDGWWLPFVIAKHFGVSEIESSYIKTKEFMVSDQFQLTKTRFLKEGLANLQQEKDVVLVTNSDIDDVNRLLTELDLQGIFKTIIPSAKKPVNTHEHFQSLLNDYNVSPQETLSIGDNFINEIAPALKMGMSTIFISNSKLEFKHLKLLQVNTLENFFV